MSATCLRVNSGKAKKNLREAYKKDGNLNIRVLKMLNHPNSNINKRILLYSGVAQL